MVSVESASARQSGNNRKRGALKFLRRAQIKMIDDALVEVGQFGEVRLIVSKGRLRFVVTQRSHDALQWEEETRNSAARSDGTALPEHSS